MQFAGREKSSSSKDNHVQVSVEPFASILRKARNIDSLNEMQAAVQDQVILKSYLNS